MNYALSAIIIALVLVASACTNSITPATQPVASAGELKEFTVTAYQFGFEPSTITVKKGDRVRLTFTSRDVEHGVFIPDFGKATQTFGRGQSETVEFIADKSGSFDYFCSVYCGSGHPTMKGSIVVTE